MRLDETAFRLLGLLQADARMSVAELARRLHRSEATTRDRIQGLEGEGVLRGYRTDVDQEKVGLGATAIVRASIDMRELPRLRKALQGIPNVLSSDVVSGERPIRIRIVAATPEEMQAVLRTRIAPLGLDDLDIRVVLSTLVPVRAPDLEAVFPSSVVLVKP